MWNEQQNHHGPSATTANTNGPLFPQVLQSNGPQTRLTKSAPCSPLKPLLSKRPTPPARSDSFHVIHKVPVGDTPYVKAKHVQLVDKDPNRAIALFWAAINAGDRVDSALKDMAIVMKQQNRPEEAIEAIKSLRYRCSDHAQESLDNVLLDLYKRCGRLDDQIALLKHKLHLIHQGLAFNGRRTKTARSQGKKFQVSIEQEATRLLGNLGWAYMQQSNFVAAEAVYRKALSIEPDNNKVCNLGICLMKQGRLKEAKAMLRSVKPACGDSPWGSDSHLKSFDRAQQMLQEMEAGGGGGGAEVGMAMASAISTITEEDTFSAFSNGASMGWKWNNCSQNSINDSSSDLSGALFATSGFGPSSSCSAAAAGAMVSSTAQRPPLPPSLPISQVESTAVPQKQQNNGLVLSQQKAQQVDAMAFHQHNHNKNQGLALASGGDVLNNSSNNSSKWEEEDAEQGFGDENNDQQLHHLIVNNPKPNNLNLHLQQQSMNWHAEVLRAKLEKVMVNNNTINKKNVSGHRVLPQQQQLQSKRSSNINTSASTPLMSSSASSVNWASTQTLLGESNGSLLNSAALPFVVSSSSCPNTCGFSGTENHDSKKKMTSIDGVKKKASSSPSSHLRSPSLLNLVLPERSATPEQGKKSCCKSLSFSTDKQENHSSNSGDDAWSSLGFIQADSSSPLCTIATVLRKRSSISTTVSAMSPLQAPAVDKAQETEEKHGDEEDVNNGNGEEDDDDFQRRLQVFVEMTLPV